jgi:hypothetical protein
VGELRFYRVACDILELGRGVGRRKCVLRLISAEFIEAVRPRSHTAGREAGELLREGDEGRDLQTMVAPLVSDSWTRKSIRSDRTRTSRSTVT